ncbi:MAG: hypothetical protein JJ921_11780 [Pseudomonadales bacterium]|nr:hypothetical protein [Pseudomonadales bacterium]MBO7007499.1 hypothetical protein [Pseudomonadales bacterium]
MSKDVIAGIVAVTGIALAIGVLVFGDHEAEKTAVTSSEKGIEPQGPQVVYQTIERTIVVEKEATPPQQAIPFAVRNARNEMRSQQQQEISDFEPTDEELMREAVQAEAIEYRLGI